jgi:hypothetical protein
MSEEKSPEKKENSQDNEMASIEIKKEELARESERERKQARYITYGILLLFACFCIYVLYKLLTQGSIFELDIVSQFAELIGEMF